MPFRQSPYCIFINRHVHANNHAYATLVSSLWVMGGCTCLSICCENEVCVGGCLTPLGMSSCQTMVLFGHTWVAQPHDCVSSPSLVCGTAPPPLSLSYTCCFDFWFLMWLLFHSVLNHELRFIPIYISCCFLIGFSIWFDNFSKSLHPLSLCFHL